jgi:hypothetical protein
LIRSVYIVVREQRCDRARCRRIAAVGRRERATFIADVDRGRGDDDPGRRDPALPELLELSR